MRTLERKCGLFSNNMTCAPGEPSAQAIAAKKPAAPPPTMMTRFTGTAPSLPSPAPPKIPAGTRGGSPSLLLRGLAISVWACRFNSSVPGQPEIHLLLETVHFGHLHLHLITEPNHPPVSPAHKLAAL